VAALTILNNDLNDDDIIIIKHYINLIIMNIMKLGIWTMILMFCKNRGCEYWIKKKAKHQQRQRKRNELQMLHKSSS